MVLRVPTPLGLPKLPVGPVASVSDAQVLSVLTELLSQTRLLNEAILRLSPEELLYASFPADGTLEPLPAGLTIIDFRNETVTAPDGRPPWGERRVSRDFGLFKKAQSMTIVSDSLVTATVLPGVGSFIVNVQTPIFGNARHVEEVRIQSAVPYNLFIIVSTSQTAPDVDFMLHGQGRYVDSTITKANAASIADVWTNLAFVPRWDTKVLPSAFGADHIFSIGCLQKIVAIRNFGTSTVEVRALGGLDPSATLTLEALGLTGFILDPDIHVVGTSTENFVSIPAGDQAVLESGLPWGIFRVQARVPAASASGASARLVAEYTGFTAGAR